MRTIVLATRNPGKVREIVRIFQGESFTFVTLSDYPDAPEVVEDGTTFRENAAKKAVTVAKHTGQWALGEDSGIEVDALDGRPGVYSARYAGDDRANNRKLLEELRGVPDEKRTARYRCVIVVSDPDGKEIASAEGSCEGRIGHEEKGSGGFGYDPLFIVPEKGLSMAELGDDFKNTISHRAKALADLREMLEA